MGKCECTVKFLKNFFILSQNEYVKIQKVCKSLDMLAVVEFTMSGYDHLYAFVVDHISRLIYINDLTEPFFIISSISSYVYFFVLIESFLKTYP